MKHLSKTIFKFLMCLFLLFSIIDLFGQRAVIPPIINKTKYVASSTLPKSYGYYYTPEMAGDKNMNTWWSPNTYDRETCWLQISYNKPTYLNHIKILAGSHYPYFGTLGDLYPLNLRIKVAYLEFSDGTIKRINLQDIDEIQTFYFSSIVTSYIRIRPLEYYPSEKWNDPCISYFYGGYN